MFFSHCKVSAQEVVYHLLSIPLKKSSRQTIFVNIGMPETQVHVFKPKRGLEDLPDEDIFPPRYIARPVSVGYMFSRFCKKLQDGL